MSFNEGRTAFIAVLVLNCLSCCYSSEDESQTLEPSLKQFIGTLEIYQTRGIDVVYLLDESGSIGSAVFPHELLFTELTARIVTLSSTGNRAAVVTFSSGHIERFNYIQNSVDKNMCTFVRDVWNIDYKGGGTNTADALRVAEQLLRRGRTNSEKVIILISDGKSNSPEATLKAAIELKQSNHIIFAVGVADVNEEELLTVATGKEYIYILKDFAYIQSINDKLKTDTNEIEWDSISNHSLCNSFCLEGKDCCDSNAACFCGTKGGKYECACNPGYTGQGHKKNCLPCSRGTYSSKSTKKECTPCPENSTTQYEGSTGIKDCFCLLGYEGDPANNVPCRAVECAKLLSPEGGTILPDQCGNTFDSTCTFKCHEGYCPYACNNTKSTNKSPWMILPKDPRKCLETKQWSGVEFFCEKIKCPSLNYPKDGIHNCSGSDFGFGTVCHMKCNTGFILHGSETWHCKVSGEWNGENTVCKAVTCPPLKENKVLIVKPKACHTVESVFDTTCQYLCKRGYKLVATHNSSEGESVGVRKCRSDGTWSRMDEMITCKDNSPPVLQCPQDINAHTDKHKPTALVKWQLPNATDNVEVIEQKILYPPKVHKPPHSFNIGITPVTYIAVDRSGLNTTCSFQVAVIDSESPRVEYCPTNITKLYGKNDGLIVNWEEPKFIDNSGKVKIVKTRNSGSRFYWNHAALITYVATDPSGNDATCNFYVTVKQYQCQYAPPPLNGAVACETWLEGHLCTPYCEEDYDFVAEPENTYMCLQQTDSAKWGRLPGPGKKKEFKFPWPDCGKKVRPKRYTMKTKLRYYSGECPSKEAIQQMQENFVKRLDEYQYISGLCPKKTCAPENVVVKCGKQTVPGINHISASRRKRTAGNISDKRSAPQSDISYISETNKSELDEEKYREKRFKREDQENSFIIEIAWDIQMSRNETEFSESCEECDDLSEESIAEKIRELQLLAMPELQTYAPDLSSADDNISFVLIPECDIGQVARNMSCVNCPFGTYYNENLSECVACPVGQFQDNEASSFCKKCPSGSSTVNERSKSVEDCRKFCSPGSYSETGMETCQACPVGTYQHLPAQKDCNKCDEGTTTWTAGSSSLADCTTMCPPGTYSDTGFHPCTPCPHGTYQPLTQGTECTACASGLTTRIEGAHASEYCQVVDFCKDHMPCMHGGTCMNIGNSYSCSCVDGFEGRNCEINIDDCSDDFCLNNGTCIDEINSYYCACLDGFTGQICEININDCNSESCLNGGTCIDGINKFVCKCPNGFTGDMCEINFYDCASDPCQNGGTCFDQVGSFRCCCPKGYTGKFCEQEIKECDIIDCYNGGTCIDKLGGFQCICSDGFEGEYCEKNIDDCQVNDCKNNGICVDGISNYTCQCPSTFTGHHCETELSTKFGLKFSDVVTSNYVKLQNKKSLSAVTVSFWMRTDYVDKSNRGTPISYSFFNPITRKEVDNGLTLLDVNKFVFYLHGKEFHTGIIANSDQNWHHCAITWESLSGNWLLYWDGAVRSRGSGVAIGGRLWKGYFVIGQEQDGIGLAFSTLESYKGEISQFNVWDHVLPSRSIEELRSKCGLIGNVIAWTDVQDNIYGSVTTIENTDLCSGMEECTEKDCYCVSSAKPGNESCWRAIPSCEPNPCTVGQQCITKYNGVSECNCKSGFEGVFCQYDVDECITNNGNCSHFCINTHGSYHCSCPFGMRLAADKGNCIDISFCEDNGLVYLNGEAWTKKCEECTCVEGEVNCTRLPCQKLECKENENEVFFPGDCCSSCFGGYSSCILHHEKFHTFDNLEYSFSGNCRYSLMDDCFDGQFSVQYEDMKPKSKEKTVYIYVHCLEIYIEMPGIVLVNGEKVDTPYRSSSLAHIIPSSEKNVTTLFIYTTHGIIIKWESPGRIEINVPQKYKKQVCGLCGNFNENKTDDYQTKQHLPARTVKDMALSWKVDGYKHCRNVTKKTPSNPIRITHYNTCKTSPYHMQQKARKQCSLLKQQVFRPCYKHINPLPYYKLCLQDSCSCLFNEQCYCDSIMSYIAECKRNKINIKSQKILAHCEMECTGGTVYDECGPACVEMCKTDLTASYCRNELCVPGCHCPAGMALHNGKCIYKYQCPK